MIKFFRKIRHKLLNENKVSKYLLYAIGEIVLVVIGILIALQINNWNSIRKANNEEFLLYSKLLNDLNDEFESTNFLISREKRHQDVHYHVYNESKGRAEFDASKDYNSLQWIFPYHIDITEKYTESLSSITNDSIRDLLKTYMVREKVVSDAYLEWNELKAGRLRPFFNKHGIHDTESAFNDRPYTFWTLLSIDLIDHSKLEEQFGSTELDELLFDLRFKTSWIITNLKNLKVSNNSLEQALINVLTEAGQSAHINKIPRKNLSDLLTNGKSIDEVITVIQSENKNEPTYLITESIINSLGYSLVGENKLREALKIFKLNTELYPEGANTWDSYGECLLLVGDQENGIKAYEKAIELNPDNTGAIQILSDINNQEE